MSSDAKSFNLSLDHFKIQSRDVASQVFRKIVIDLDSAVVRDTPVDTGRARGNWFPTLNSPSDETTNDKRRYTRTGNAVIGRVSETAKSAELGDTVWLTNNLPYINRLENGYSEKSTDGMVGINILRSQSKFGGDIG